MISFEVLVVALLALLVVIGWGCFFRLGKLLGQKAPEQSQRPAYFDPMRQVSDFAPLPERDFEEVTI